MPEKPLSLPLYYTLQTAVEKALLPASLSLPVVSRQMMVFATAMP